MALVLPLVLSVILRHVELVVPWSEIATILNRMIHSDIDFGPWISLPNVLSSVGLGFWV